MNPINKEIFDYIDDNDNLNDYKFSTLLGCHKQQVSKYRTGENINFRNLIKAAYIMKGERYLDLLEKWIFKLETVESIKHAFEFSTITRNVALLKDLLDLHKDSDGTIGECVQVYSILYNYQQDIINGKQLTLEVSKLKNISNKSLQILLEIIKMYGLYYEGKYLRMLDYAYTIQEKIKKLSDKRDLFIKECFVIRISEILTPAYFHLNKLKETRYYANFLISTEICAKISSDGYYYLGMSYLTEDAELSIKYLRTSYDLLKNHQKALVSQALSNLNFGLSILGLPLYKEEEEEDVYIKMFNKIKRGIVLEGGEYKKLQSDNLSTYKKFYRACLKNNVEELCLVASEFFKSKNFFFSSLVAHEIKKINSNVLLVDSFLNFTFDEEEREIEKTNFSCFRDIRNLRIANL